MSENRRQTKYWANAPHSKQIKFYFFHTQSANVGCLELFVSIKINICMFWCDKRSPGLLRSSHKPQWKNEQYKEAVQCSSCIFNNLKQFERIFDDNSSDSRELKTIFMFWLQIKLGLVSNWSAKGWSSSISQRIPFVQCFPSQWSMWIVALSPLTVDNNFSYLIFSFQYIFDYKIIQNFNKHLLEINKTSPKPMHPMERICAWNYRFLYT